MFHSKMHIKVLKAGESLTFKFFKINNYFEKNTEIFINNFYVADGHSKQLEDNYFKFEMEYYSNLKYENNHLT